MPDFHYEPPSTVIPISGDVFKGAEANAAGASGGTQTSDSAYVSEVVIYGQGKGPIGSTYVGFYIEPFNNNHTSRDIGALEDGVLVTPDPRPQTPLEWELAIDIAATTICMKIAQLTAQNPNLEYGAYIYVTSNGEVDYTPITTGTATEVQVVLPPGISASQVVSIVHLHPAPVNPDSNINHFPSPAITTSDGSVKGDWAVYDYYTAQSSHPELMRTYIINQGKMWEYNGNDRDPVTEGMLTPYKITDYRR